jgi:transposase-like protein
MPKGESTTTTKDPTISNTPHPLPSQKEFREYMREYSQQGLRVFLEQVMREELDALLGCEWGETSSERSGYRNGYRYRDLLTSQGKIPELKVPRDREGQFQTEVFEKYHRAEPQIEEALLEMFCAGTSQEKVGQIAKTLTGVAISDSAISRLTKSLDQEFKAWRERQLLAHYQIVYLDALYFTVRYGESTARAGVLVGLGVTPEGSKEVLGLTIGAAESLSNCRELLQDLRRRGVAKISLIGSDGSEGFIAAIKEVFPDSLRQRCLRHKQEDILGHIPTKARPEVSGHLQGIFNAPNKAEALTQLAAFKVRYQKLYPEAIRSLEQDEAQSLSFYELEAKWWKFARTTNAIESLFSGVRNRTNPIKLFTTESSCLIIVWAAIKGIKLAKLPINS